MDDQGKRSLRLPSEIFRSIPYSSEMIAMPREIEITEEDFVSDYMELLQCFALVRDEQTFNVTKMHRFRHNWKLTPLWIERWFKSPEHGFHALSA